MTATTASSSATPAFRFSTGSYPEHKRVAAWREVYGREMLRLDVEPLSGAPLRSDLTVQMLPGLGIVSGTTSPCRVGRTRELLADGDDSLFLHIPTRGGIAAQLGREVEIDANDAILMSAGDVGSYTLPSTSQVLALRLPRARLARQLRDADAALVRPVPRNTEALRLLTHYVGMLRDAPATPALATLAVTHVHDLVALTLGATRDAAEIASDRGARAARLREIKTDIAGNLGSGDLSVAAVAARHRLQVRYVQRLLEAEGMTFTEFVLGERLARAHRQLTDSRFADRPIATIAFAAGFADLSYFNRAFRRRFGAAPSDVRTSARVSPASLQ